MPTFELVKVPYRRIQENKIHIENFGYLSLIGAIITFQLSTSVGRNSHILCFSFIDSPVLYNCMTKLEIIIRFIDKEIFIVSSTCHIKLQIDKK